MRRHVAVIGGGIAGMSAALELSHHNLEVHLIEKGMFLGGQAIHYNCKADGRCQQCGACLVEKKLKEVNEARNVHVHLGCEIVEVHNQTGYELILNKAPQFASSKEQHVLRSAYRNDFHQDAVLRGPSKNNVPLYALNPGMMDRIRKDPAYATLQQGLDVRRPGERIEIEAEAVVLATGFSPFSPHQIGTFHYASLNNVVSALDMEQVRKEKGSYLRPSDGNPPQRIAFIQCVGSRNEALGRPWCSRVCCSYALRMARAIRSEQPHAEVTFFYMDLQNPGRDAEEFLSSCRSGFRFIRMMPVDILPDQDPIVDIHYMHPGQERIESEHFDLVVLSVGIGPARDNSGLSELLEVPLDRRGFFEKGAAGYQTATEKEGLFLAGTSAGPKDIAESIEEAGLAAKELLTYLSEQEKKHYGHGKRSFINASSRDRRELDRHIHSH